MANEAINVYGTQKTLEASGASTADATMTQADDASYNSTDSSDFPDGVFSLSCAFGTAPAANSVVYLYARPLNFDGTNDAIAPSANFRSKYIGTFLIANQTATQYSYCVGRNLPKEADYYIFNDTGQTISAGWTLKVTPLTIKPAV